MIRGELASESRPRPPAGVEPDRKLKAENRRDGGWFMTLGLHRADHHRPERRSGIVRRPAAPDSAAQPAGAEEK
jgi:hypothetical protein